jgi:glycosyltransferase involved in cell wall biosynthesis
MKPVVSIIIPAHDEEHYLGDTLEALHQQSYPYFEIIVVANGCKDRTAETARDRCDKLIELPERALGKARNTGAAKARGDLLIFLDADTRLEPHALDVIASEFTPGHSAATVKGRPDILKLRYMLFYVYKNFLHRFHLHCGSSGVICCWRDQFKEVGGFDPELQVRENSELIERLKQFGPYRFIGTTAAVTSMRRYEKTGAAKGAWQWLKIWFQSLVSDLHHRTYDPIR